MSTKNEIRRYSNLRRDVIRRLRGLGAPEEEFMSARAHFLGGHVAWYFGDTTRTSPAWLSEGNVLDSGKTAAPFGDRPTRPSTDIEWNAVLLAVLNTLLDTEPQSKEWWLLREKANHLDYEIRRLRDTKRHFSSAARKSRSERVTTTAVRQIAHHIGSFSANDVLTAMRDRALMDDWFESRSEPLAIGISEVEDESQTIHFRRRDGSVGELKFRSLRNTLSKLRKEGPK